MPNSFRMMNNSWRKLNSNAICNVNNVLVEITKNVFALKSIDYKFSLEKEEKPYS